MGKIRAFILDDEPPLVRSIKALLERNKKEYDIEVIGTSSNALKAIDAINQLKPNVIFLDVEMPHLNGFELLEQINYPERLIIFVTAYRDYAVEAINVEAFQYLVKPLSPLLFSKCIKKVHSKLELQNDSIKDTPTSTAQNSEKIAIRHKENYELYNYDEIISVNSEGSYSTFKLTDGHKLTLAKNLKQVSQSLSEQTFMRINRSTLINTSKVKAFSLQDGGTITMLNGEHYSIGKTYRDHVLNYLKQLYLPE